MSGNYFVTGKLGAGKSLACVGKIRDALIEGRPVATNLDIDLSKLVGPKAKNVRLYRVPDKPTVEDFEALPAGNTSYDEEKNGLLVLDECGTWFNAREWNDRGRRPLINWLVHARKRGWDCYFILHNVKHVDKQAREICGEFVVHCRRMDRINVPILDGLSKLVTGKPMPKKKWHLGIVKWGDNPQAMVVDRWWYIGSDLYPAYDTKQQFNDDYPHRLYTVLPPWYTHGRYQTPRNLRFYMRLTKIYFRRYSRTLLIALAFGAGVAAAGYLKHDTAAPQPQVQPQPQPQQQPQPAPKPEPKPMPAATPAPSEVKPAPEPNPLLDTFGGMIIQGIALDADHKPIYVQIGNETHTWNLETLRSAGYEVFMSDHCSVLIMTEDRRHRHRVHTTYCPKLDRGNAT